MTRLASGKLRAGLVGLGANGLIQSLSLLYLMVQLRDQIRGDAGNLSQQWGLLALLAAVLTASRFIERAGAEQLAVAHIHSVRQRIFRHFLSLPGNTARRINRGGLLMRLTGDLSAIRTWIIQGLVPLISLAIWLSVATATLMLLDPVLVALLLAMLLLAMPVYWLAGRALYNSSRRVRQQRTRLISHTTEKIAGISLILATNQMGREARRFERLSERLLRQQQQRARWVGMLRALTELTSLMLVGSLALVGHYRIEQGPLSTDQFVMITLFGLYMLPQFRRLGRVYEYWTGYRLGCHKLERFLARKVAPRKGERLTAATGQPLSVSLPLAEGTLKAPPGARIMLSDPDNRLVTALQSALNAERLATLPVELNGTPLEQLSATETRRRIVIIGQALQLWGGSLRHNLTYGMRKGREEDLQTAIELCGLTPLVNRLEKGLDTPLKPHDHALTEHECFAIQVCRALLRRPSLLVVDHPGLHVALAQSALMKRVAESFTGTLILRTSADAERPDWVDTHWSIQPISAAEPDPLEPEGSPHG